MRQASDIPPPRGRRGFSRRIRVVIAIAIVALIILTLSLRGIAGFYTDYLWFDSLGYSSVWRGVRTSASAKAPGVVKKAADPRVAR